MPKRRVGGRAAGPRRRTAAQSAAARRNLMKARAARRRQGLHARAGAAAKRSMNPSASNRSAGMSMRKSQAFTRAALGKTGPRGKRGGGKLPQPTITLGAGRPKRTTALRRARAGRTLRRASSGQRAAGVRWGAELHGRIGSTGSVTAGTRSKAPKAPFRPQRFGRGV